MTPEERHLKDAAELDRRFETMKRDLEEAQRKIFNQTCEISRLKGVLELRQEKIEETEKKIELDIAKTARFHAEHKVQMLREILFLVLRTSPEERADAAKFALKKEDE